MTDLQRNYGYHPPSSSEEVRDHVDIRSQFSLVARTLNDLVPEGRERSLMHTKLEEAMFWANAAVARARYDELPTRSADEAYHS